MVTRRSVSGAGLLLISVGDKWLWVDGDGMAQDFELRNQATGFSLGVGAAVIEIRSQLIGLSTLLQARGTDLVMFDQCVLDADPDVDPDGQPGCVVFSHMGTGWVKARERTGRHGTDCLALSHIRQDGQPGPLRGARGPGHKENDRAARQRPHVGGTQVLMFFNRENQAGQSDNRSAVSKR